MKVVGCAIVVTQFGVDVAAVGESVCLARSELDGVVEIGERLLVAAEAMKCVTTDFVEVGFLRQLGDGLAVVSDSLFGAAHRSEQFAAIAIGDGHAGAELDHAIEIAEGIGSLALLGETDGSVVEREPAIGIEFERGVEIGEGFGVLAGIALEFAVAIAGPSGETAKARREIAGWTCGESLLAKLGDLREFLGGLGRFSRLLGALVAIGGRGGDGRRSCRLLGGGTGGVRLGLRLDELRRLWPDRVRGIFVADDTLGFDGLKRIGLSKAERWEWERLACRQWDGAAGIGRRFGRGSEPTWLMQFSGPVGDGIGRRRARELCGSASRASSFVCVSSSWEGVRTSHSVLGVDDGSAAAEGLSGLVEALPGSCVGLRQRLSVPRLGDDGMADDALAENGFWNIRGPLSVGGAVVGCGAAGVEVGFVVKGFWTVSDAGATCTPPSANARGGAGHARIAAAIRVANCAIRDSFLAIVHRTGVLWSVLCGAVKS